MIIADYTEKPTTPGIYIQVFDDYCLVHRLEKHPEGYLCGPGGRIDQMPGRWYGPQREERTH